MRRYSPLPPLLQQSSDAAPSLLTLSPGIPDRLFELGGVAAARCSSEVGSAASGNGCCSVRYASSGAPCEGGLWSGLGLVMKLRKSATEIEVAAATPASRIGLVLRGPEVGGTLGVVMQAAAAAAKSDDGAQVLRVVMFGGGKAGVQGRRAESPLPPFLPS